MPNQVMLPRKREQYLAIMVNPVIELKAPFRVDGQLCAAGIVGIFDQNNRASIREPGEGYFSGWKGGGLLTVFLLGAIRFRESFRSKGLAN
ncbi:hypothetical protein MYX77_02120 [Acidobacteriia bacterium AH_259_A11_L15]|nr:hypothetical protein [Acidobacteriia bacterium AH_259_A11_L15]